MKLTINDIAKLAGVSKTTISRVINNKPDVKPEVRDRIKTIIRENGYHPNAAAVAITKQRSYTIAMIIPYEFDYILSNIYYTELIHTIVQRLEQRGYYLLFAFPSSERYMEMAKQSRVDGFIILSSNLTQTDVLHYLIDNELPCVSVVNILNFDIPTYDINNMAAGKMATEYLISKGHRKIAYISNKLFNGFRDRQKGYQHALREAKITFRKEYVIDIATSDMRGGFDAMQQIMHMKDRPTAILCCNDYTAQGVIKACADAQLAIPNDISLLSFDNIATNEFLVPKLTTVDQSTITKAELAIDMLLNYVETGIRPQSVELPFKLMEGESVAEYKG